jgi:hypothetical protein
MDALTHADAVLAALHRRYPECLVPGQVGSPMDDADTVTIPRDLIAACDPSNPENQLQNDPQLLDAELMRAVIGRTLDRDAEQRPAAAS